MTRYALVEKGVVVRTGGVPRSTAKISGFNKLSDEKLKSFGYFPYEYTAPVFDSMSQKMGEIEYTILENEVKATSSVVDLDQSEIGSIRNSFVVPAQSLLLDALHKSDWVYLSDASLSLPQIAAYTSLRTDIKSILRDIRNLSIPNLKELNKKLEVCSEDFYSRLDDLSLKMISLKDFIASLLV